MVNPVLVEVTRGGIVESKASGRLCGRRCEWCRSRVPWRHRGGIFPRSAIKAFQCLPVIESGAADAHGFSDEELALACASHNGEAEHVRAARSMLAKSGNSESDYECGAHWPSGLEAHHELVRAGGGPLPVHNNCSGKHAGMQALARKLGADPHGYYRARSPGATHHRAGESASCAMSKPAGSPAGSTAARCRPGPFRSAIWRWALLASATGPACGRAKARMPPHHRSGARLSFMVAGTDRFCTKLMQKVPRAFIKTGAEGVFCGAIPHADWAIALKCDDGGYRGAEVLMAAVMAALAVWTDEERDLLHTFAETDLRTGGEFTSAKFGSPTLHPAETSFLFVSEDRGEFERLPMDLTQPGCRAR